MTYRCDYCGKTTNTHYNRSKYGYPRVCEYCADKLDLQAILAKSETVHRASDLSEWDHGDMSDLFWHHLGEYVKDKNLEKHFPIMKSCLYWAFHDSHGLSSSFCHALKWANIELNDILRYRGEK